MVIKPIKARIDSSLFGISYLTRILCLFFWNLKKVGWGRCEVDDSAVA